MTLDFWFYIYNVQDNFEFDIEVYININLRVDPNNGAILVKCNQQILAQEGQSILSESKKNIWSYLRCSVSNILKDFNLINNDKYISQPLLFAINPFLDHAKSQY